MIIGAASAIIFLIGTGNLVSAVDAYYADRIAPGVYVGDLDIGAKTRDEAKSLLETVRDSLGRMGIAIVYEGREKKIYPYPVSLDPDITQSAHAITDIDIDQTLDRAIAHGRSDNQVQNFLTRINGYFSTSRVAAAVTINDEALTEEIRKEFPELNKKPTEPHFAIDATGVLTVEPGAQGTVLDIARTQKELRSGLELLHSPRIVLQATRSQPNLSGVDLLGTVGTASQLVGTSTLAIHAGKEMFSLTPTDRLSWIQAKKTSSGEISLDFDSEKIRSYLEEVVAPKVLVRPDSPRYELVDGKVAAFAEPVTGIELDVDASLTMLRSSLEEGASSPSLTLPVTETVPPPTDIPGDLIIKERVAKAETDFRGSPTNRRKNISVGMSKINGIVIPAGETFSLLKVLAPIDKEGGFLPELVIKGTKTTPEYGGGLCQVSTTLFRAVSYAGLPVTSRRNHSYRVSYYEPPVGFDATIYDPAPDFTFVNDTGAPILIQASVKGTKARVSLWGTKDGRTVEVDQPTVFNIKKAGETKLIETDDLKPGEKKCTERAHDGADAQFERRVTYPDGEKKTDVFKSHYVVWPAVCLVGKKPEVPAPVASSTESVLPEHTNDSSVTSTEQTVE